MTATETNPCKVDLEERRARALNDCTLTERTGEMERRISFEVGYDHRDHPEACGGGGHGQHGMSVRFVLLGPKGATQFLFYLLDLVPGRVNEFGSIHSVPGVAAMASDLGYHSPTPRYDDHREQECELLPGGRCFYDGSGRDAGPVLAAFVDHGPHAVWAILARHYQELFG